jgi:hypothetical protein
VKEENIPLNFELYQNYPNPFNPATNIKYRIPDNSYVTLKIYDILGKEIVTLVNEKQNAGEYSVMFNSNGLPSGIYFYKVFCSGKEYFTNVKRMVLIK